MKMEDKCQYGTVEESKLPHGTTARLRLHQSRVQLEPAHCRWIQTRQRRNCQSVSMSDWFIKHVNSNEGGHALFEED